jgi:hypothetical protein
MFAVLAVIGMMLIIPAGSAAAIGGEQLGCKVTPGIDEVWPDFCYGGGVPSTTYAARLEVANGSGTYTYEWATPGPLALGCRSIDNDCTIFVRASQSDWLLTVAVGINQNGSQPS